MLAFALAIAPVVAIIWFITHLDRLNKEPFRMLFLTLLFGVFSVVPAIILEKIGLAWLDVPQNNFHIAIKAFIIIALSEEFAKYIFLRRFVYRSRHFDEPYDGIVYAIMISLGFAGVENVLYVAQGGLDVAIARMFTAVPAHATFAVLMGYWVGRAKMENKRQFNLIGLLSAVIFHGFYDFFLMADLFPGQVAGAIASLILALILSRIAIKIHLKKKDELF